MFDRNPLRNVLILGATSAVAAEIAHLLARRGCRLHLVGRSEAKLERVVDRCREAGDVVTWAHADFGELDQNEAVIASASEHLGRIDLALLAYGDLGHQQASESSFAEAERILRVNLTSVVSLIVPLANHMEAARAGRIAVITSVAGDRGRPRNYTYGAAKGALNVYLQGLRSRLYPAGVRVTTLKLGPVDSPMTIDHEKNVLFANPSDVARGIVHAIEAGASEAYVPSFWQVIMPIVKNTPEMLFQRLPFLSGR